MNTTTHTRAGLTQADLDAAQARRQVGDSERRQAAIDRAVQHFLDYADLQFADTLTDLPTDVPRRELLQPLHPLAQAAHQLHSFTGWRTVAWVLGAVLLGVVSGAVMPWGWQ